jgi:hypothetical protein
LVVRLEYRAWNPAVLRFAADSDSAAVEPGDLLGWRGFGVSADQPQSSDQCGVRAQDEV